jgi:hypothetical protein
MTPEQIRAKQKLIAAYRQVLTGCAAIREHSCALVSGGPQLLKILGDFEAFEEIGREAIETLQAIPDHVELFVVGPTAKVDVRLFELPPEGPGITEPPQAPDPNWPDSDTE